jgi:hypothetical protein
MVENLIAGETAVAGDFLGSPPDRTNRNCSLPRNEVCSRLEAARRQRWCPQAGVDRASETGSSPGGPCPGGLESSHKPLPFHGGTHFREELSRLGRLGRAARRSPQRPFLLRRPLRTARPYRHGSCPDRGPGANQATLAALDAPSPLTDHRNIALRGTEPAPFHGYRRRHRAGPRPASSTASDSECKSTGPSYLFDR